MTIICAWCGKRMQGEQPGPVSHGICPACARRFESRALAAWPSVASPARRARRRALAATLPLPGFERETAPA